MYILKQVGGMFKKNMRNISRVILGVLIVLSVASFAMIYRARSVVAGPGEPFGGLVLSITPCTCSSGVAVYFNDLTVSPPITLPLIYQPGVTITYEMYNQTTPGNPSHSASFSISNKVAFELHFSV